MTDKQTGPIEVQPNTLQGQSMPNTFRSQAGSGTVGKQYLNSGGGNTAPPTRLALPQVPVRLVIVVAVIVVFIALYVLSGTP